MTLNKDNSESEKGPGRPVGSTKNGVKSRNKKMQLLRTKTWAWTCSYYLQESEENRPVTTYSLQKKSEIALEGAYPKSIKDKSGNKIIIDDEMISADRWSRWRKGEKGLTRAGGFRYIKGKDGKTVEKFPRKKLWPETHPAYYIGPWVSDAPDSKMCCGGTFVPLWSALSADLDTLREDWFKIPINIWRKWDPDYINEKYYFGCTKKAPGRRSGLQDLYELSCRLAQPNKNIPSLVSFTACLTAARICKDSKIMLFEPHLETSSVPIGRQSNYIILAEVRDYLFEDLSKINISFQEIIDVASDHGLTIYDYYTLGDLGSEFSGLVDEIYDDLNLTASTMGIDANKLVTLNQHMLAGYIYDHLCNQRGTCW